MVIKVWNNYDRRVFRINPCIKKMRQDIEARFTLKQLKEIKRVAKSFREELCLEFEHNLKRGWENKILVAGKVFTKDGTQELKAKDEIRNALSEKGEIQFFASRKNGSIRFIKSITKPGHLRWF
jgi:hypothetical protein